MRRAPSRPPRAVDVVLDGLAVYRLTRAWLDDTYDFPPTATHRARLSAALLGTRWAQLDWCPWCSSVWIAGGVVAARRAAPRLWRVASAVLALSAAAGLLHGVEQALSSDGHTPDREEHDRGPSAPGPDRRLPQQDR